MNIALYIRALRLPFVTATIFPFLSGSLLSPRFDFVVFFIGLICAVSMHLAANLINDYADSKSGADWQDKRFFGFFGGSKLIQEGKVTEGFYLFQSACYFLISFFCAVVLAFMLGKVQVVFYFILVLLLGFFYSSFPLALSYRYLGEAVIFTLFGPACVMGGYYLQSGVFPARESVYLAIPFGFFVTAILFANEIADFNTDSKSAKRNMVALIGQHRAYLFYYFLMILAYMWVLIDILAGYLSVFSCFAFLGLFMVARYGLILREHYDDKDKLLVSSRGTISIYNFSAMTVIVGLWH